jgi:hypothetical protein
MGWKGEEVFPEVKWEESDGEAEGDEVEGNW